MHLRSSDIQILEKVREYVETDLQSKLSITDLCAYSNLSESKLTHGFKFLYQVSIFQYRLTNAMEYAKNLLAEGKQVKEVAILLGYSTAGHFSRAFLKVHKQSPGKFKVQ